MTIKWQQRCYPRREQRSWHWYPHGVDALEGNEGVPSPYRDDGPMRGRNNYQRDLDYDYAYGLMDARAHRSNAAIGVSYRVRARRAARR
jgi:hypothetical protein